MKTKKWLWVVGLVVLLGVGWAYAEPVGHISQVVLVGATSRTIVKNTSWTSPKIDLASRANNGFFSLQYTFTGSGVLKFEYLLSNDGATFAEPSGASDIASGLTTGSDIVSFEPEPAAWMQIKVTETGTAANAVLTNLWLAIQ